MDPVFYIILLIWTGLFWSISVGHKIVAFSAFVNVVSNYKLLPNVLIFPASISVVILEFGIICLLFINVNLGVTLAMTLLVFYGFITAFNLLRGHRKYDCGCLWGGEAGEQLSWVLPIRNFILAVIISILFLNVSDRLLGVGDVVNIAAAIIVFPIMGFVVLRLLSNKRRFLESGYV